MAIQTLNDGESGLVIRGKINDNFSELVLFNGTWSSLLSSYPAASHSGKTAVVTDATYFINPLRLRSDGTKWRLDGVQDLYFNITPLTGAVGPIATEQLQKQWTAPAGFLTSLRSLAIKRLDYKTATSDTYNVRLRVGAGATPLTDTLIYNNLGMSTTNRANASASVYAFPSVTQVRILGSHNTMLEWNGVMNIGAYPQNFTTPDSDAANTVFSCTMIMTTGTDSSSSGQAHIVVTGS